jgi:SAM-dependent methyltransferase
MSATKTIWEKGDYTRIAASMRESGEALVPTFGIKPGLKVLDLGCGDGTTALPAARLGAEVLGVDTARNLIAAARQRAEKEGLANLRFQIGDASDLAKLKDDTFDLVVSVFGAMFADRPLDVAKEMVRVTRPGGRIVMANWIPNDPSLIAQIFKIRAVYAPPPEVGFPNPLEWGIEANVIERFVRAGIPRDDVLCRREMYDFTFPGAPADLMNEFRTYHGETMEAFEVAEKNGRAEAMRRDLCALFERLNASQHEGFTSISAAFLRVTVTVP